MLTYILIIAANFVLIFKKSGGRIMNKLYFKLELRIGKILGMAEDGPLAEKLYYSDGYGILENRQFEGFVTRDYICGEYDKKQKELFIEMLYSHQIINSIPAIEAESVQYISFSTELDELCIPDDYTLEVCENEDLVAEISFVEVEKNPTEISKIEKELQTVKKLGYI